MKGSAGLPETLATAATEIVLYTTLGYYLIVPVSAVFLAALAVPMWLTALVAAGSVAGVYAYAYRVTHP